MRCNSLQINCNLVKTTSFPHFILIIFWKKIIKKHLIATKVVATCNYNDILKKSNMVDYICMYDVYKLPYRIFIFNSLATILQLTDFLT
jgi:hypothetical protein